MIASSMSINATLVVEVVVFMAVLAVLARFVIRPLQAAMHRRQAEIDEALAKAQRVEDLLAAAEADYAATVAGARREAAEIIDAGRRVGSYLAQEHRNDISYRRSRLTSEELEARARHPSAARVV
jgi:F-type H+-transporting ATPase subunit b